MSTTGKKPGSRPGPLLLAVAKWPAACVSCGKTTYKGDPIVFRAGERVRWCWDCSLLLISPIKVTKAYLERYGEDDRVRELARRGRRPRRPDGPPGDWRAQLRHISDLKGRFVRIRRGAQILDDANPSATPGAHTARAQVVKVDHVLVARDGRPDAFRWAGGGGYFREASCDDIEAIVEP